MLEYPIQAKDLESFLPHRPPMVWIFDVLSADALEGVCRVLLSPDGRYLEREGVRISSAVEWVAQAHGFSRACYHLRQANRVSDREAKLKKAYLVGIRQFEFAPIPFPTQGFLKVSVKTLKEFAGLTLISGRLETEDGQALALGTLKVFTELA